MTDQFIRTVVSEVRGHDAEYEKALQEREKANPKYAFFNKDVRSSLIMYCLLSLRSRHSTAVTATTELFWRREDPRNQNSTMR